MEGLEPLLEIIDDPAVAGDCLNTPSEFLDPSRGAHDALKWGNSRPCYALRNPTDLPSANPLVSP